MRALQVVIATVMTSICFGAEQGPMTADWAMDTSDRVTSLKTRLAPMETAIRSGTFKKIGSVLIARHGELIYEAYFDGDADTQRDTRSATKSITGALVGLAIKQGSLASTQVRILDVLPARAHRMQNVDRRKWEISVEDFLTMSSPLECDDWNDASRGNEERMYLVEDWAQFIVDLPIRGRSHLGNELAAPPFGRSFSYCTGGVFMLSEVIEKSTRARTDRFAQARLFDPLGIRNVTWVYSPMNTPQTGGGLRMTSRDLLKIVQLYLDGGKWHGTQILDEAWVHSSTQPHAQIDDQTQYGYLWWLKSFASGGKIHPAFYMSGNGGNKAVGLPALGAAVVITSTNYNTRGMHEQTEQLLTDYILEAVATNSSDSG
ncbi:MAG: serine hydrolase domain-containing protein [Steroidobacteraceae bacterium]